MSRSLRIPTSMWKSCLLRPLRASWLLLAVVSVVAGLSPKAAVSSPTGLPAGWRAEPPVIYRPIDPLSPGVILPNGDASPPFDPAEITGAYGLSALSLPNTTGAGITIAIVDAYGDTDDNNNDIIQSDLQTFCTRYGLPYNGPDSASPTLTEAFPSGTPSSVDPQWPGWSTETALDVEWVHSVAPGAHILLVVSPNNGGNLYDGVQYAAHNAPIVTMSWGGSEFNDESSIDTEYFSSSGVAFFASTGDDGEGTEYPSVSPDVVAVGGTSLTINSNNQWVSETGWAGSGGGISTYEPFADFQEPWLSSGNREVPDVSADADPNTGVHVYRDGGWEQVGGTSLASPLWAGFTAVLDGNLAQPITEAAIHSGLYLYGDPTNIDTYFHDIVSGNNGLAAGPGYDLVTGIGTPILNLLLPALPGPPAPTGLSATAGIHQVTLNWTAGAGATSYAIYRATTSDAEQAPPVTSGVSGTAYTDTTASNGATYYYKVAGVSSLGTSTLSNEASATLTEPPPPTVVTAAAATPSPVSSKTTNLSVLGGYAGSGGESALTYTWSYTGPAGVTFSANGTNAAKNATATFTQAGSYTFTCTINAPYDQSVASSVGVTVDQTATSITTAPGPTLKVALRATQQFTATVNDQYGNPMASQPTISWSLAAGGVGSISGVGLYHSGAVPGTSTVKAHSGAISATVAVTVSLPVPAAPTLTATSESAQVTLNWTASEGALVYRVYRSTTAGGEANPALAGGLTATSYTDTNATGGVPYYYKVTAVNTGGASPFSNEAHATPTPASPTSLTATGGTSRITLNWTASAGAIVYRVYRSTSTGDEANPALAGGLTSTSYTDTAAAGGTTYYYKVTAVDTGGASPFSNEAPATPEPAMSGHGGDLSSDARSEINELVFSPVRQNSPPCPSRGGLLGYTVGKAIGRRREPA